MSLPPFTLHRPTTLDDALELLQAHGEDAAVYMGGTELLLLMKLGFAQPAHLVDGKRIPELAQLSITPDRVQIGAGVTHRRLERHGDIARTVPALATMSRSVANVRVRNMGTIGGNLCFAEPHSDPAALLLALDAEVELAGRRGRRRLPLEQFTTGAFSTAIEPGEVMTSVSFDMPAPTTRVGYQRLAFKERPTVAVAVALDGDRTRIAVGAVGPMPQRVPAGEEALRSGDVDAAAAAVTDYVTRMNSAEATDYHAHLAGVLTRRACRAAVAGQPLPAGP